MTKGSQTQTSVLRPKIMSHIDLLSLMLLFPIFLNFIFFSPFSPFLFFSALLLFFPFFPFSLFLPSDRHLSLRAPYHHHPLVPAKPPIPWPNRRSKHTYFYQMIFQSIAFGTSPLIVWFNQNTLEYWGLHWIHFSLALNFTKILQRDGSRKRNDSNGNMVSRWLGQRRRVCLLHHQGDVREAHTINRLPAIFFI